MLSFKHYCCKWTAAADSNGIIESFDSFDLLTFWYQIHALYHHLAVVSLPQQQVLSSQVFQWALAARDPPRAPPQSSTQVTGNRVKNPILTSLTYFECLLTYLTGWRSSSPQLKASQASSGNTSYHNGTRLDNTTDLSGSITSRLEPGSLRCWQSNQPWVGKNLTTTSTSTAIAFLKKPCCCTYL